MPKATVSVSILTLNEERNISDCLDSVSWADEIVVIDSFSSDRTAEICRERGVNFAQHRWAGINAQRAYALSRCTGEWILSLDADERVSSALREEIRTTLPSLPVEVDALEMPRRTRYLGKWILHGGWYPDRKVRLFRRGAGAYVGQDPHDRIDVPGEVRRLRHPILHYTYRSLSDQVRTIDSFANAVVDRRLAAAERFRLRRLLLHPPAKFLGCYVWKAGFLDGMPGLIIAAASAFSIFLRHAKHWEQSRVADD